MMKALICIFVVSLMFAGCSGNSNNPPAGVTGTGGSGGTAGTTGTGTSAPTGTVGTSGPSSQDPGSAIPSESKPENELIDDSAIEAAVLAKLQQQGFSTITLEVDKGVVTLKGTLSTQEQAEKAVELAQTVGNVQSVTSEIKVTSAGE